MQQRSLAILKLIMGNQKITIESLQAKTHLTRRQITYDITLLNRWLKEHHYLEIENKNGIFQFSNDINAVLADLSADDDYILNEKERQQMIYLYLYIKQEVISMYHLVDLLGVSRGTVNEDLKKLDSHLKAYGVKLHYSREKGYFLSGTHHQQLYVAMEIVVEIISYDQGYYVFQMILDSTALRQFEQVERQLTQRVINHEINMSYNNIAIVSYIYVFYVLNGEQPSLIQTPELYEPITDLPEYEVARAINTDLENDRPSPHFLATLLLAYATGQDHKTTADYPIIAGIIDEVLTKLKRSYTIKLNDQKVFTQLYSHIRPALYRVVYQFPIVNPIKAEIISQYNSLYIIVEEVFASLALNSQTALSEDELAYLTIHFETFLSKEQPDEREFIHGAIVCPNGIGISVMLYQQLTHLFPDIIFSHSVSVYDFKDMEKEVDIVFSTLLIETSKPLFLVSPIMNNFEKAELVNNVHREFNPLNGHPMERLLTRLERYVDIKDREGLINELTEVLSSKVDTKVKRRQPMLGELLDTETIQLNVTATDWRDAIRKSAQPLLDKGKVTDDYVQAIIHNAEETGPYIVITKHVALPHARPDDGAKDVGLTLMTLTTPVAFGHEQNDPVKYVFCLSAVDNTTHLQALSELVDLLGDDQFYQLLDHAESPREILSYVQEKELAIKK